MRIRVTKIKLDHTLSVYTVGKIYDIIASDNTTQGDLGYIIDDKGNEVPIFAKDDPDIKYEILED